MPDTVKIEAKPPEPMKMTVDGELQRGGEKPAEGKSVEKPAEPVKPVDKPVEGKEEKKPEEKASAQFAALARKEKMLVQRAQELKTKEAGIQAQLDAMKKQVEETRAWQAKLKSNPLAAIEEQGIKYNDLTQQVLNDKKVTPDLEVRKLREEVESYKKQQEDEKKKMYDEEKKRLEAQQRAEYDEFHKKAKEFVKANAEKYEVTVSQGAEYVVPAFIELYYAKFKKVLQYDQAADMVEKDFEEQITKALATKKFQAKVTVRPEEPSKRNESPAQRTLDNKMTPQAHSTQIARSKNDEERLRRAIAKLEPAR